MESLVQKGYIKVNEVAQVMKTIDRADFISKNPYKDSPQCTLKLC